MLLVYRGHQGGGRGKDLVDEDEDGLLGRKLNPLADHVDKLAYGEICGDEVLLLVDGRDIRLLDLLANNLNLSVLILRRGAKRSTHGNAVVVLLTDALGLGLALLKGVLVLELGAHLDRVVGVEVEVVGFSGLQEGARDLEVCGRAGGWGGREAKMV